jgi:cell division protein FtsA
VSSLDVKRLFEQCESELANISNKDVLHKLPLSYKIDGSQVMGRPIGMKGAKLEMEILFITSLSQHVDDLIKAVENIGIAVEDVVAAPYAASFAALTTQQKEVGCILANIGSTTVSIIVFEEGVPISLEVFPIGSTHITNDIALGLQIPIEEAEKVKIDYGSETTSKKKLADIIEARLNDIFDLIEAHLKKISRNGLLPAGIILVGGGSNLISLDEIAKSSLKLPARICKSFENNFSRTQGQNSKDYVLTDPAWSIPLGLIIASDQVSELGTSTIAGSNILGKTKATFSKLLRNFLP